MKKLFFSLAVLLSISISAFSQAKNPIIMVVPMDVWCQERGFWDVFENNGDIEGAPNYQRAVQDSRELMLVISKINTLMSDRGFPLKDLSGSLRQNTNRSARNSLTTSKKNGRSLTSSPLDELNRTAKADILLEVDWCINNVGPKHSIEYKLRAIDAYTGKQVAGEQGTGAPQFTSELSVLLEEAVVAHMDRFINRLQQHFNDIIKNGREVNIEIGVFDNESDIDLEREYNGEELADIIEKWMSDNTVNHVFNTSERTESIMYFENVRIPLLKTNGTAQDASGFLGELRKYLKTNYNITTKNNSPSLGFAQMIIGEK